MQHRITPTKTAPYLPAERGMTLMEVMIAMFIFVVSILGYSKLQSGLFHQGMDNRQRSIAIWKAEELIEIISANSAPSSLAEFVDAVSDPDVCLIEPAKNCIEVANSKASSACSTEELARYDVWNTLCAEDDGSAEQLLEFSAELECNNVCGDDQGMTLRFGWLSVMVDSDSDLHDVKLSKEDGGGALSEDSLTLMFQP